MLLSHLPKIDGGQAKEEESVSPPCLVLMVPFQTHNYMN